MNIKKNLQEWEIEEPGVEEIQAIFEQCKTYLTKEFKYETSKLKQIYHIIYSSQKKWFLEELLLSIGIFFFHHMVIEEYRLYFLSFISILLAALMMLQCFRNLNCNVWELENSCMITTQKVLTYKVMIMASINFLLLFLMSLYTTTLTSYHFLTVLSYGVFPFFLTCAFILDLGARFKNNITFAIGFMGANILSFLLSTEVIEHPSESIVLFILSVSILYGIFAIKRYFKTMEKEGGGLLWN